MRHKLAGPWRGWCAVESTVTLPASLDAPVGVAHAFVRAINRQSAVELHALMTEDHVFIDSLGNRAEGREKMKAGWEGYFGMVPDYTVAIEETFPEGPVVLLFGTAQGTYSKDGKLRPENSWSTPAAWRAVVRDGLIAEWRVYADNEPIRQVMARNR